MVYRLPPWRLSAVFSTLEQTLDWSLSLIKAPTAWLKTRGSYQAADGSTKRVKVLVIDTGIQVDPQTGKSSHPDLLGAFVSGRDFTGSPFGVGDQNGHGTATAALLAANNNETGIAGVCSDADVYVAKALGDDGSGDNRWIAAAVDWGNELDVDVISFSGGSPQWDADLAAAIDRFLEKREERFFIAAAGNDGTPNSVNFPASHPYVLAVGAVDRDGRTAAFSSQGDEIDCAGPGDGVKSCNNRGSYGTYKGTSFACPLIAGVVVLMLAWHRDARARHKTPLKTFDDLLDHIQRASVNAPADQLGQGWGVLMADAALDDEPEPQAPPSAPEDAGLQIQVGPFVWSLPAVAGHLASIGIAPDATDRQKAEAKKAIHLWLTALTLPGESDASLAK